MFHPLSHKVEKMMIKKDLKGLVKLLKSNDPDVKAMAARSIASLAPQNKQAFVVKALIKSIDIFEPYSSRDVCEAIGAIGDKRACNRLLEVIRLYNSYQINKSLGIMGLCDAAIGALGDIGDLSAVEPLIAILQNNDLSCLMGHVLIALGRLGDKRAIDPILSIMGVAGFYRKEADEALQKLGYISSADTPTGSGSG